ncbi:hypothetical protein CP533_6814 [Ophiocordyceps camponoti-saundersi (nom. inval.)]|nr:hypothetical protein CP533_6814 [Ophiocordyceps camponoti-saundersi (nom. inval.)]
MAKSKSTPGVQNRAIFSRASYLYQAASYLSQRAASSTTTTTTTQSSTSEAKQQQQQKKQLRNLSRRAISDMRAVTRKAQIRQSHTLKRSLCSTCNTLLVEGDTCRSTVENASRGARKPWADVLVVRCVTCDRPKRFPVAAPRQVRASLRRSGSGVAMRRNSGNDTSGSVKPKPLKEEACSSRRNEDSSGDTEMGI